MKHPHTRFISPFLIVATLCAGLSTASADHIISQNKARPIVITPPAVNDGSNASRAPYVAARRFDDVNAPNGEAVDLSSPPNTVATNIEAPVPAARIAILQPATIPAGTSYATVSTEPVLTPTGRSSAEFSTAPVATVRTQRYVAQARARPIVITPPAVNDGSNASRAPYVAARRFDDVNAPNGEAVDLSSPPNTVATNIEAPVPAARIAILQPATIPAGASYATVSTEPVLTPTGRSMVAISTSLDAATVAPSIRTSTFGTHHQLLTELETRVKNSDRTMATFSSSMNEMSAEGRKAFNVAAGEVTEKAKALKKSMNIAHHATDSNWENARTQLAADFEAYAAAVARVDTVAGVAPANR